MILEICDSREQKISKVTFSAVDDSDGGNPRRARRNYDSENFFTSHPTPENQKAIKFRPKVHRMNGTERWINKLLQRMQNHYVKSTKSKK